MRVAKTVLLGVCALGGMSACKKERPPAPRTVVATADDSAERPDLLHMRESTPGSPSAEAAPPAANAGAGAANATGAAGLGASAQGPRGFQGSAQNGVTGPNVTGRARTSSAAAMAQGTVDAGQLDAGPVGATGQEAQAAAGRPGAATATQANETANPPANGLNPYPLPGSNELQERAANGTLSETDHSLPGGGGNNTIVSTRLLPRGASTLQGIASASYDPAGNAVLTVDVFGGVNGTFSVRIAEGTACANPGGAAPEVYTGQVSADGGASYGTLPSVLEDATAVTIGQVLIDQDGHGHFETSIAGLAWPNGPAYVTRKILIQEIPGASNPQLGDTGGYVGCGVMTLLNPRSTSG